MELISIPLKKPFDVDIVKPFKNLIQARYSTADKPEDYSEPINDLSKLRNNAIWRAFEKYESSLEVIYGYYDQLVALESKIPPGEVQIPFKWKDAFDKGSIFGAKISLTVSSLSYEKICVLFNIAALQSAVAASQSLENDEGLKLAAKLLQQAAGNFNHLKAIVIQAIQQEPTRDLSPDTLGALSQLMLAQAQEVFVHKAIHDQMKDAIVAKLAAQCEDLYADCDKVFNRENFKTIWSKDMLLLISAKQSGYAGIAHLYQSFVSKNNKMVGEEITWLTQAEEYFKAAQSKDEKIFQDLYSKAKRHLAEARKDNDFIYHERIPDIKSLPAIAKAQLAKMIPPSHPMSQNFRDLFSDLVPVAVHQALAAYDVRKNELVNAEITKLRESTQLLNSVLASLNLPAAIETTEGNQLPPSIIEKANGVKAAGGIEALEALIRNLPELLKRNQEILDEAERMLNEEASADKSLREQFKAKWSRTPSEKLTEMFRSNIAKFRETINNAVEADKSVRSKFESHRKEIELLSKSVEELQDAVPSGGATGVAESSAVKTLRNLMEEVEVIKAERDVIESELNSATSDMKVQFLGALANDGAISEAAMSMQSLAQTFGGLQAQVRESLQRQEVLIEKIQNAHADFVSERGSTSGTREKMMCDLASAFNSYMTLQNNLKEGSSFYNQLTNILVSFQMKISDFCFARKTEKEELLKDLTQETSRQAPKPAPSQPTYHQDAPAQPPSSAPQSVPSSLPYPVYVQGMPVPYGATNNTPYPSYMPPPMPQSYNPYGTLPGGSMPYPMQYNFPQPGGYPQQGPYQPGSYPQQHPGNYQQPGGWPQQP